MTTRQRASDTPAPAAEVPDLPRRRGRHPRHDRRRCACARHRRWTRTRRWSRAGSANGAIPSSPWSAACASARSRATTT
ncbi:MAG: hypothetical protein HC828_21950 [Blastochloris sp.]|nr:hypothetical protein [Blastochloris sp.]